MIDCITSYHTFSVGNNRAQLYKGWIMLSDQQINESKLYKVIHQIEI